VSFVYDTVVYVTMLLSRGALVFSNVFIALIVKYATSCSIVKKSLTFVVSPQPVISCQRRQKLPYCDFTIRRLLLSVSRTIIVFDEVADAFVYDALYSWIANHNHHPIK